MAPSQPAGNAPPLDPDRVGRVAQMMVLAFVTGLVTFGAIAVVIRLGQEPDDPMLAYIAAGATVVVMLMSSVLPQAVAAQQLRAQSRQIREAPRQPLAGMYVTRTILRGAPLEGAAFFNLIAYIVSGQWWTLGIVAVLMAMLLVPFPSQTDFENWAEQVQRDLPP
jgi:hypothetical protein